MWISHKPDERADALGISYVPPWFSAIRLAEKYHDPKGFGVDFSLYHWAEWAELIAFAEGLSYDDNHIRNLSQTLLLEEEDELRAAEELANQTVERQIAYALARDKEYQERENKPNEAPTPVVLNTKRTPNRAARAALIEKQKREGTYPDRNNPDRNGGAQ